MTQMSDAKTLGERIDALARQVAHLNERLVEAETRTPGAANEPPPHY